MSRFKKKCLISFEFISTILIIISFILYIIQSFINQNFTKFKSKSTYTERLLYEKFSEEIYNNIHSYPVNNIQTSSKNEPLILQVKLDTFFDCQGVENGLLNEDKCQNKIVNNLTCCKSTCCGKDRKGNYKCNDYNFNVKQSTLDKNILIYNYDEMMDDPKRRYCEYYNVFSDNTSKVLDYTLEKEKFNYSYENILLNKDNINTYIKIGKSNTNNNKEYKDFTDCGEIDSLKNHLYLKGIDCPINFISIDSDNNKLFFDSITESSLGIIVHNYLSEIPPLLHEWNYEYNSEKVTIKDINNLIKKNSDNSNDNNYYKKQDAYFYINQLPTFEKKYKDKINTKQKIYWYTTNYIGFETVEDLNKFKSIFNENDTSDNPLYKIREKLYPSIETSVICIIFVIIYIILLIKLVAQNHQNFTLKKCLFKLKKIFNFLFLVIYLIIFLFYTQIIYKKIKINIDSNYKKILDLYNERKTQKCFMVGIIIHIISCACEINYFFECGGKNHIKYIVEDDKDKESVKSGTTFVDNNNLSDTIEDRINDHVQIIQYSSNNKIKDSLKYSVNSSHKIIPFNQ